MSETPKNVDQFGNTLHCPDYLGYGVHVHLTSLGEYRLSVWRQDVDTRTRSSATALCPEPLQTLHEHCICLTDDEIDALIRYRERLRAPHDKTTKDDE